MSALVFVACGWLREPPRGPGDDPTGTQSPVEVQSSDAHPRISLVARRGDPVAAVAVAVTHDLGSRASAALAALVGRRLRSAGFTTTVTEAFDNGFVARTLVPAPEAAAQFVQRASEAFSQSLSRREMPAVARDFRRFAVATWDSRATAGIGRCSGELGAARDEGWLPPRPSEIERWRQAVYSSRNVAFSAVGPKVILEAARTAVARTPPWPEGRAVRDPWPERGRLQITPSAVAEHRLSIAVRVAEIARALEAANELAAPDSDLALKLAALEPSWTIDRAVGTLRPRGACLRLDLSADAPPPLDAVARVALVAERTMKRALAAASGGQWILDEGVLSATDPGQAAAVAAWRSLSGRLEGQEPRRFMSYTVPNHEAAKLSERALTEAMRATRERWQKPSLKVRQRIEPGQGELWILLATPCGTSSESAEDAGSSALTVAALAMTAPPSAKVTVEPWVSTDGVGLLAHGPRLGPTESPTEHARRIARVLARALTNPIANQDAAAARARTQGFFDADREPLWKIALGALAPGHPSWIRPRGTWQSISAQSTGALETRRRELARGPLRLAVLANRSAEQVNAALGALDRWLRPMRRAPTGCSTVTTPVARPGEYVVETSRAPKTGAEAVVAVSLVPDPLRGVPIEAEWTALLLNREGGWLDQALRRPGLASQAQAKVLGGRYAAALLIELTSLDAQIDEPVAQVRALLEQLSAGALTTEDVRIAQRYYRTLRKRALLDPRSRLVRTWLGSPREPRPTLESLGSFQRRAFRADRHIVVVSKSVL